MNKNTTKEIQWYLKKSGIKDPDNKVLKTIKYKAGQSWGLFPKEQGIDGTALFFCQHILEKKNLFDGRFPNAWVGRVIDGLISDKLKSSEQKNQEKLQEEREHFEKFQKKNEKEIMPDADNPPIHLLPKSSIQEVQEKIDLENLVKEFRNSNRSRVLESLVDLLTEDPKIKEKESAKELGRKSGRIADLIKKLKDNPVLKKRAEELGYLKK